MNEFVHVIVLIIYSIVNVYIAYIYTHIHMHIYACTDTHLSLMITNVLVTSAFCLYTIHMMFTGD